MEPFLKVVQQLSKADCGIATLAMYLGKTYLDVFTKAIQLGANPAAGGMSTEAVLVTAQAFGVNFALKRVWDYETSFGILAVERVRLSKAHFLQHLVLLKWGLVFDTDATVWEPDEYMRIEKFRPLSILEEVTE